MTGDPRGDLVRVLQACPKLNALVDAAFPRQPALIAELQDDSKAHVEDGCVCVNISVMWTCADGSPFGSASLELYGPEATCLWEGLDIERQHRQKGFGTQFRVALVELCRDLGLNSIRIYANKVGRYAWARAGFPFLDDDERDKVVDAAKAFAKLLGIKVPILDSVKHPSEIADLGGEIDHEEFARLRGDTLSVPPERPMTLGQALLLGPADNAWYGELDLTR